MSGFNTSQPKYVFGLGRNRCAIGSITRQYNYLARTSQTPFCSLFNFNCQSKPASATNSTNVPTNVPTTNSTVPGVPTNLSAIVGDGSIEITFTQPSNGGSPITNYQYSLNGGSSWSAFDPIKMVSPVTINSLTNGTVYDIKLRAINAVGAGDASSQISIAPIPSNNFAPSNISGLNLWLDGQSPSSVVISNNKVTAWNDKSGLDNHFASGPNGTISYSQPSGINNRPAIHFETSPSTYLSRSFNISSSSNELSLFMIVNHVSTGTSGNSELFFTKSYPGYTNGSLPYPYEYFDLFTNMQTSDLQIKGKLSINIGNQTQLSTGVDIRGSEKITLINVIATSTADIYVNGTQTNNNVVRGGLSLNNILDWAISGGAFQGYVGEIVTYPSGLSDSDRQKVEGYLAWKWGIQNNLPDRQPYKNAPPISLDAPVITGITGSYQTLSVAFTQTNNDPNITITNYQYSTDNGATFRALATPDITSPLTINRLSSDGITMLTNGVTYDVIIQAKTANGLGSLSNMFQGTPSSTVITQFTEVGSTTWTAPPGVTSVDYLVVGGGGGSGGGFDNSGGGGGGGGIVRTGTLSVKPGDVYNITVGDGGEGGTSIRSPVSETNGSKGGDSVFASIESLGGGGGYGSRQYSGTGSSVSFDDSGNLIASTGGSGGGGGKGGNGGGGNTSNGNNNEGSRTGGIGGLGISSSISGSAVIYGVGGRGADAGIFNAADAGYQNTGNGARGGGTSSSAQTNGAKGGSGIVILKYTHISLVAPVITGITGSSKRLSVDFTQTTTVGLTITNYQYSTDNGATFRALATPDVSSPLIITTLSSNGTTLLTNGVTYNVIIQAKTANDLSPLSNMVQGTPFVPPPDTPTALSSVGGNTQAYILFTQTGTVTNYEYSTDNGVTFRPFNPPQIYSPVNITVLSSDGTTPLTNGIEYTVKLKAVNDGALSSESVSVKVTPEITSLLTTNRIIHLDANNSSSYNSSSGSTWTNLDSNGAYSATLLNSPIFNSTNDSTNKWFTFNGTNQIADISEAAGINPTTTFKPFTIQIWARVNTASPNFASWDGLISKQFGPGSYDGYSLSLSKSGAVILNMNGGSVNGNYYSSTEVYSNGWALYTIVVSFGGGSVSPSYAYVSTRRVVTANNTEGSMPSPGAPLQFPKGIQEGDTFCPADVGAFYYYNNTALSQEDIIRNYDATKSRYGL